MKQTIIYQGKGSLSGELNVIDKGDSLLFELDFEEELQYAEVYKLANLLLDWLVKQRKEEDV